MTINTTTIKTLLAITALSFSLAPALAAAPEGAAIGAPAPDFSVVDANGKTHKLADYKGKRVVLEWSNKDCPYVKKHYGSRNMQKLQEEMTGQGLVWLTVLSSAKGKQGHLTAAEAKQNAADVGSKATAILLDDKSVMAKAYGAQTTPHMFVIDDQGVLQYSGAIDSNDSADPATIAGSENYVRRAVASVVKGEKLAAGAAKTQPYGCSVKY